MVAARYQGTIKADIFFIDRGENLKAIRENGLQMQLGIRTIHTAPALATDNPAEIGPVDYLFCCTISYDLEENIQQLKPVIGPETVIIPLLNGLDIEERIHNILPEQEVWKGCVNIGSRMTEPGVVEKFSLKERIFFGNKDANKDKQTELLKLLMYARLNAFNPADIDLRIWKKFFMISTAATITSYFNETIGEVVNNHIDLFITLGIELKSVAEAKGIRLPDGQVFSAIDAQQIMPNTSTPSMHSDFQKGNRTEVETLTGYVVRTAQELGIEVPTYQFMYKGLTEFPYPMAD